MHKQQHGYSIVERRAHRPLRIAFLSKFQSWKLPREAEFLSLWVKFHAAPISYQYLTEQINSQNSRNSQLRCLRSRGTN